MAKRVPAGAGFARRRFIEACAAFAGVAYVRAPARSAQFEFKCGASPASSHPTSIRQAEMWAAIEQESGGRIHTQYFPANQLGTDPAMFTQMRLGAIEFTLLSPGVITPLVPAADITNIGLVFKDLDEALRVMDSPLGDYVRRESNAKGLYAFHTAWDSGMIQVSSTPHPIRVPSDLQNFKIRVVESKIIIDLFKALGASATTFGFNEIYSALQTHVIDGEASSLVGIEASRFYEVQKYISLTNHAWAGTFFFANGDVWKKIPPDLQAIIERNASKYALLERSDTKALNATLVSKLTAQGIVFNQVDQTPFRANARSYFQFWAKEFGSAEWGLLESSLGRRLV